MKLQVASKGLAMCLSTVAMSGQCRDLEYPSSILQNLRYAAFTGDVNGPARLYPKTWPWDRLQLSSSACKPQVRFH